MNENLIYESDENTRRVLVEKVGRYYYKINSLRLCDEKCSIFEQIYIGSANCSHCIHNIGFNDWDRYIICKKIKPYIQK